VNSLLNLRRSLIAKLIVSVGSVLLCTMALWAYANISYQKQKLMQNIVAGTDRLTNTIRLGTHYAMMHNSREDITHTIQNISRQPEIQNIRIYNKEGQIKFSNSSIEVERTTNIKDEACFVCHRSEPPLSELALDERTRIFRSPQGYRLLGILSGIPNDPGCATGGCHFHPADKKILGALDVVVSLEDIDAEIVSAERKIIGFSIFVFFFTSAIISVIVVKFVNRPTQKLIAGTAAIAAGNYTTPVKVDQEDEMGQLAEAINKMAAEIGKHEDQINKQRDEYQDLFEGVPCLITVQDRNYRMMRYNREFGEVFAPQPGDYCYRAYKGRDGICPNCPVQKTFEDGHVHTAEESGVNKDGSPTHWLVRASPIRDAGGRVVAAMEISLDITERKHLELELAKSEEKYHAFFNSIPNPVFVLDMQSLIILDCNDSVQAIYGFERADVIDRPFTDLFIEKERTAYAEKLRSAREITQAKHLHQSGNQLYVNIRISPSVYGGRKVLLVTTSDITKRLEAEQQLIQASKMATLGEMATGVAHELNQPLSVIKTTSSFFMKKLAAHQSIDPAVLETMLTKVDRNVDRAANIINHMRQFARKSEMDMQRICMHQVLESAFEIFSQQLKVRGIEVNWAVDPDLPKVMADPGRLEQVFINLLLNARDAIEERAEKGELGPQDKVITITTSCSAAEVLVEICDTGIGIPPAIADRLFEPFFTTKKVGQGTGLGLSISYGIVQECGGTIKVVPGQGQGACFVVSFPKGEST